MENQKGNRERERERESFGGSEKESELGGRMGRL